MKTKNTTHFGCILLYALMCLQVIGSFLTFEIPFGSELNASPASSWSVSNGWHVADTWVLSVSDGSAVSAGSVAYRSPNFIMERDEEPDDLGMDENKANRLRRILEEWCYEMERRFRLTKIPSAKKHTTRFVTSLFFFCESV